MTAPPGAPCCGGHVRPLPETQGLEIGHVAGKCTRRGYATFTIATACYCQPCRPAPKHPCVPRQGLRPAHGSRPSRLSREPPFGMQTCSRHYVAACANPCHFAGTRAARRMGLEEHSTDMATTHSRAPAQVCSPGWQRSWSNPGCALRTRRWERMARLSPSSGSHTLQPQTSEQKTVGLDLVVYGATPHGGALCCDATLASPLTRTGHPQPCTVTIDGAALTQTRRVPGACVWAAKARRPWLRGRSRWPSNKRSPAQCWEAPGSSPCGRAPARARRWMLCCSGPTCWPQPLALAALSWQPVAGVPEASVDQA